MRTRIENCIKEASEHFYEFLMSKNIVDEVINDMILSAREKHGYSLEDYVNKLETDKMPKCLSMGHLFSYDTVGKRGYYANLDVEFNKVESTREDKKVWFYEALSDLAPKLLAYLNENGAYEEFEDTFIKCNGDICYKPTNMFSFVLRVKMFSFSVGVPMMASLIPFSATSDPKRFKQLSDESPRG